MSVLVAGLGSVGVALLLYHWTNRRDHDDPDDVAVPPPPPPANGMPDVLIPPARPATRVTASADEQAEDGAHNARQREVMQTHLEVLDVPREIPLSSVLVKRPDESGRLRDGDEIWEPACKLPESEVTRRMSGKVVKTYKLGNFYAAFNDTDRVFSVIQITPEHAFPDPTAIPMPVIKYSAVPEKTYSRTSIDAVMANLRRQADPDATTRYHNVCHGAIGLCLFECVTPRVIDNRVRGVRTLRKLYTYRIAERL
eukprot:jgi/Mesvir1/18496/Mv14341-RA.1